MFGIDPVNEPGRALAAGVYPVTEVPSGYSVSHYQKESNNSYTAVPDCVSLNEMTMIRVIRSVEASLPTLRVALGLPATEEVPQAIDGYYPLYVSEAQSNAVSTNNESHEHELNGVTYYMPSAGVTMYHGTYVDPLVPVVSDDSSSDDSSDDSSSGGGGY